MTRTQFWIASGLGFLCLLLVAVNASLVVGNRSLQRDVATRQQFVQQSVQLEGLYREIVRALAELAARNNDADVRTMLARHGITYTLNPPAAGSPAPAPTAPARR
jgi:hypothetical protein